MSEVQKEAGVEVQRQDSFHLTARADQAPTAPLPCPHCGKTHTLTIGRASEELWNEEDDGPYPHSESVAVVCSAAQPNGPGGCGASGGYYPTEAEAVAAWNRRAATSTWQPIETAPKDRQILLGRVADLDEDGQPRKGVVAQGCWIEGYSDAPDQMGHDDCWTDSNYSVFSYPRSFGAEKYRGAGYQPTHWMPLPDAPSRRSADTEGTGQISPESAPAPESDLDLLLLLQAAQALEIYAHAVESGMVDDDLRSAYAHASPVVDALRQRMDAAHPLADSRSNEP